MLVYLLLIANIDEVWVSLSQILLIRVPYIGQKDKWKNARCKVAKLLFVQKKNRRFSRQQSTAINVGKKIYSVCCFIIFVFFFFNFRIFLLEIKQISIYLYIFYVLTDMIQLIVLYALMRASLKNVHDHIKNLYLKGQGEEITSLPSKGEY